MRAVEKYYSVAELSLLLSLCTKTVLEKIHARELGDDVVNLGSEKRPDYRVPASAVNEFLAARRVFFEIGVPARTTGELRRKVGQRSAAVEPVAA